jgi:CAP-Gly domain.
VLGYFVKLSLMTDRSRVQGERYFSCLQNYGAFVRPEKVKVGDYPVEELQLDLDEEM